MTELSKDDYQSALLSQGAGDSARRSETVGVTVQGQDLDIEVRSLSIGEYQQTGIPPALKDGETVVDEFTDMQPQTLVSVHLVMKCCYKPGTDERIFDEPDHARQILNAPFHEGGWVQRLFKTVAYVHGNRKTAPDGVESPHLTRIAEAADDLRRIADSEGELNASEVADIANRIANYAQFLDQGQDAGKVEAR